MTTQNPSSSESDNFKTWIAICIAVVTLLATVMAYMQSDAGARDDRANRDSKRYAIEAFGRQVSGDAQVNFDYNVPYQVYYENLILSNSAANREDEPAALRYETLANEATALSPMLKPPYYNPASTEEPRVAGYEVDTYLREITTLREKFVAASAVKDAWDAKANTYILHLTLLAISLFMFGLSVTISGKATRWIFAATGAAITIVAVVWAGTIWAQPVFDLREASGAIDSYAEGVSLAYQGQYTEAVAAFDKALAAYPNYASAAGQRAAANMALGNTEAAIADYQKARAAGDGTASLAGELAYAQYTLGRFDQAIAANKEALAIRPDELWIRFDLALANLASGQVDAAKAEYKTGMDFASKAVADARAAGKQPPSDLWWSLGDAADSLESLVYGLETGESSPLINAVSAREAVMSEGDAMVVQLKSLAAALEYTGLPPAPAAGVKVSDFAFAEPNYDDQGEVVDYQEPVDSFASGLKEFAVLFDYENIQPGQEVLFKLYINDEEDPSWRILETWQLDPSGSAVIPISYAYSDTFEFEPGSYSVELYVNYTLVQRGYFSVEE